MQQYRTSFDQLSTTLRLRRVQPPRDPRDDGPARRERGFERYGIADHSRSHCADGLSLEEIAWQHGRRIG
jgi:hypothetical protein